MYLVFYPLMNEHSSFQCYNNIYCNSIIYIFLFNVVNASRAEIGRCLCSAREHKICCKSISNTLACGSCATFFCSYHILTSSVHDLFLNRSDNMESDC